MQTGGGGMDEWEVGAERGQRCVGTWMCVKRDHPKWA